MKLNKLMSMSVLMTGWLLTACQLEPYQLPAEELYAREFIKKIGAFDKAQDWNMAARQSVTVNPGMDDEVKVYAVVDGKRYIFAHYTDVQGRQTLPFDLPKGVTDIIVKVGSEERQAKVGDTVDFSRPGSRTVYPCFDTNLSVWETDDYVEWSEEEVTSYREMLPEEVNNRHKYTQNFIYESDGEFVLYPLYWNTGNDITVGVYYYDGDKIIKQKIYKIKEGNTLQYYVEGGSKKVRETDYSEIYHSALPDALMGKPLNEYTDEDKALFEKWVLDTYWNWGGDDKGDTVVVDWDSMGQSDNGQYYVHMAMYKVNGEWKDDTLSNESDGRTVTTNEDGSVTVTVKDTNNVPVKFRSKGIVVKFNQPTKFGFYIIDKDGYEMYSEQSLNGDDDVHVVTTPVLKSDDGKEYFGLGFEDWYGRGKEQIYDMNDVIFRMYGSPNLPKPKDEDEEEEDEEYQWVLAAEDLGNIDDFDFNDMVVSIAKVAGRSTAKITALAAGGTLPLWICYDGKAIDDEFHKWFGDYDSHVMINTGAGPSAKGKTVTIDVATDFSMNHEDSKVDGGRMGGFYIMVERKDGTFDYVKAPDGSDGQIEAPQMLCLPGGWRWPKERKGIHVAYPGFNDWCKDHNCNNWHESPAQEHLF